MAGLFDAFKYDAPSDLGGGGLLSLIREQAAYKNPVNPGLAPNDSGPDSGQTRRVQVESGPNADMMSRSGNPPSHDPVDAQRDVRPQAQRSRQTPQLFPSTSQDFGQRLIAGLSGVSSGVRSGGLLSGLLGGLSGLATGVSPENRTANGLSERAIGPGPAQTSARDPELMRVVLPRILALASKTRDAGKGGVKLGTSGGAHFVDSPLLSGKARSGISWKVE